MDTRWLEAIFREAGLPPEVATAAGREAGRRLLERAEPRDRSPRSGGILAALVTDPTLSVTRILERGRLELPFHDPDTGRLSVAALADVLMDVDEDPVPAMAFARVVSEAVEPEDFYRPIWEALGGDALGGNGLDGGAAVDLACLARLDWSPLRPAEAPGPAAAPRKPAVRKPSVSVRPPKPMPSGRPPKPVK